VGIGGVVLEPSGPARICVRTDDGHVLDVGIDVPADATPVNVRLLCEIRACRFSTCPICGDRGLTVEHVPPQSVGGAERTLTCARCNNGLATLVEADLHAWFDQRLVQVGFRHDSVRGLRRVAPVRVRSTRDGQFAVLIKGSDPALPAMLDAGGQFSMECAEPDPVRYEVALLKHAYLAACLHLREVPAGRFADAVRRELVAVRDARNRHRLPPSPLAGALMYGRSYEPAGAGLYLAWANWDRGPGELALVLGGIVVSWPLDDVVLRQRAIALIGQRRG